LPCLVGADIVGLVSNVTIRFVALTATILAFSTISASAQQQQRQQARAAGSQTPDGDLWLTTAVGLEYRIDRNWTFHLDAQLRLDSDISRLRDLQVRPGFEYAFNPTWAIAAGYVQFTRYASGLRPSRGPFQDVIYRTRIDGLPFTGRLRWEELFFDNGALLVRARTLAGVRIPLGTSPWELALSDEVFINVGLDSPARQGGFAQNRAFAGFGRQLTASTRASAGYELDTFNANGTFRNVHNFKFNIVFSLN